MQATSFDSAGMSPRKTFSERPYSSTRLYILSDLWHARGVRCIWRDKKCFSPQHTCTRFPITSIAGVSNTQTEFSWEMTWDDLLAKTRLLLDMKQENKGRTKKNIHTLLRSYSINRVLTRVSCMRSIFSLPQFEFAWFFLFLDSIWGTAVTQNDQSRRGTRNRGWCTLIQFFSIDGLKMASVGVRSPVNNFCY